LHDLDEKAQSPLPRQDKPSRQNGQTDATCPAGNETPDWNQWPLQVKAIKPSPSPQSAAKRLKVFSRLRPKLALVLGSGFHHVVSELDADVRVPYAKLPGFPPVGVSGHAGELFIGHLGGTPVIVLSGRAHFYEGHSMERVTFPVRVLAAFGIRDLLLTSAAGGINKKFHPGDFMVFTDHINLMGVNPLHGALQAGLPAFVDLTRAYDAGLAALLKRAAWRSGLTLRTGVYLAVCGPSYETPAEIRAFACLGADAVGMSTVPEAVVARQCGLRVAAVSCVTNLAAGRGKAKLFHDEVLETAARVKKAGALLLKNFARLYAKVK
jgi:purine-nucleoside phosphorylase